LMCFLQLSMDVPFDIVGGGRGCTTNCGYTNVFPDVTGYCWAADNGAWHSYADAETACDADVTCKALNCKKDNGATVDCTNYKTSSNLCCQLSSKCGVSGKHDPGRWNRHNKVHGSPADQARVWNWALMQVCEHASQHNEPDLFQRVLAPSENAVSFYPRTFPTYGQTRWTAKVNSLILSFNPVNHIVQPNVGSVCPRDKFRMRRWQHLLFAHIHSQAHKVCVQCTSRRS